MSEDWKNDRAEAEMRKHEAEMMQKLNPKQKQITKTWTITATSVGENAEKLMGEIHDKIVCLDSYVNPINGLTIEVTTLLSEDDDDEIQ